MRVLISLQLLIVLISAAETNAAGFDNPVVGLGKPNLRGGYDTVAVLTYRTVPQILTKTIGEIALIKPYHEGHGIDISITTGPCCNCTFDSQDIHIPEEECQGDTVRTEFTFIPHMTGPYAIEIYAGGGGPKVRIFSTFVIDETGLAINPIDVDSVIYGSLGLLPEYMTDSLVFTKNCYANDRPTVSRSYYDGFGIKMVVKPSLSQRVSDVYFEIVPYVDFDQGVVFQIIADDQFRVKTPNRADWDWSISRGEVLKLDIPIEKVRKGIGTLGLKVYGFQTDPKSEIGKTYFGAELVNWFVIDQNLNLIAYGGNPDSERPHANEPDTLLRHDGARMDQWELIPNRPDPPIKISSEHFIEKFRLYQDLVGQQR